MELDLVMARRKSVRSYTAESVSREAEEALIEAAQSAAVGMHNDVGYVLVSVRDEALLQKVTEETTEKTTRGDPRFGAPLLLLICRTKDALSWLEQFDAGIIAEHIHLKATELGLGSVILRGFIRSLGEEAEYLKEMRLPDGVTPLLAVAVGHSPVATALRKENRKFAILWR